MKCFEFDSSGVRTGINLKGRTFLAVGNKKIKVSETITRTFPWFGVRRLSDVVFATRGETITALTAPVAPACAVDEPFLVFGSVGLVRGSQIKASVNGMPIHCERVTHSTVIGGRGLVTPSVVFFDAYEVLLVMQEGDSFVLEETFQEDEYLSFRDWFRGKKPAKLTVNRRTEVSFKNGALEHRPS